VGGGRKSTKSDILTDRAAPSPLMSKSGAKRKRTGAATYRDPVPHDDGYGTIFEREATVKRFGSSLLPSFTARTEADTWSTATTWGPPDDLHFALDPDGELYDRTVDADVMEEPVVMDKLKKSKVSVSRLRLVPYVQN